MSDSKDDNKKALCVVISNTKSLGEDTRLALLEQSIAHVDQTLLRVEGKFNRIDDKFEKMDSRFERTDANIASSFKWIMGTTISLFSGLYATIIIGIVLKLLKWI